MTLGLGLAACLIGAAVAALAVRRTWLVVTVRGTSMMPTLRDGQRLIARRGHRYINGDIIVFRIGPPGAAELRIKRVVAVGGDPIPVRLRAGVLAGVRDSVPARHVVVSGDNPRSEDSRHVGFVPDDAIQGIVRSGVQITRDRGRSFLEARDRR